MDSPVPNNVRASDLVRIEPMSVEPGFDCWNRIGTEGDRSCTNLDKFILCRQCPVYARAGLRLFDRPLPPDYRRAWAEYVARKRKPAVGSRISALIFRVGLEYLALPTQALQEVVEHRPVHSIPHRRHGCVLGLVNVRGELLLCVSLGRLLNLEAAPTAPGTPSFYSRLLVVVWEEKRMAFPVDEVRGIHWFSPGDLRPSPTTVAESGTGLSQGLLAWEDKMAGLLEPESVFANLNQSLS